MTKQKWKAGNMVNPLPVVMVSCGNHKQANIITVAWTGTLCTNPPMTYISIRPSRYSYQIIKETGFFVVNLTTKTLARATDYCGVKSGKDMNKFVEAGLTPIYDNETECPMIAESPVNIECKVRSIQELGSHHMFIADILNVYVDDQYIDEKGRFHLNKTDLIAYSHGSYMTLGKEIGTFGYSVKKKNKSKKTSKK
jgi:flavin reductase (DIM6/NTAB) family NADH-FMN oxidoreductase RutF